MPSRRKCTLSSGEVHTCAAQWLEPLRLKERGVKCVTSVVLRILFLAAARIRSIGAVCRDLSAGPSDQALYDALEAMLPENIGLVQRRVTGGTVMQDLVREVRRLGLKIKVLLLDRGFYSVAVMRSLRRTRCDGVSHAATRCDGVSHAATR